MMTYAARPSALAAVGLSALVLFILSLGLGPVSIDAGQVLRIVLAWLPGMDNPGSPIETATVQIIRLPRALTALATGAMLAGAGAVLQGLTRNVLVEPALIGVSSGAAVGAALVIVLGGSLLWLPVAAFVTSLAVCLGVMWLARVDGQTPATLLLLSGVAANALAAAVLGLLSYAADDAQLRTLTFWLFGSLARTDWQDLAVLLPLAGVCAVLMLRESRVLDALSLGDAAAGHLGFAVEASRRRLVLAVALGVGVSVAFTGVVAFVGLVVPHLVRLLLGASHKQLLPGSMLLGGSLTLAADILARLLVAPAELPIGIVTSLCGAPFFIILLALRRRELSA